MPPISALAPPGRQSKPLPGRSAVTPRARPVDQDALYQMGSTSKSFTAAVILQLEAAGRLSIILRYPRQVVARISGVEARDHSSPPQHDERYSQLFRDRVDVPSVGKRANAGFIPQGTGRCRLCPSTTNQLTVSKGYHYSNTNYVLAAMVAEKASGKSFTRSRPSVGDRTFSVSPRRSTRPAPTRSRSSSDFRTATSRIRPRKGTDPIRRIRGTFRSIRRDVREMSTSWMQSAGGAVSNARDVDRWMRAVFNGKVVPPKQQQAVDSPCVDQNRRADR